MKPLTCSATLRRLHAFHDHELAFADEIAVSAHLEWCPDCAGALADLRLVRAAVRATAPGRTVLSSEEAASLQLAIVSRAQAEREVPFLARVEGMRDDLHVVYAGLGAAAAAVACMIIVLGMLRFATTVRPDSFATIVNMIAAPGSNGNPVAIDGRMRLPRVLDWAFSEGNRYEDAVFTLAAIVTREGRIVNLELLRASSNESKADEAKLVEGLLDAVSRARFEPARVAGLPVAVNMVWLVARTTVYGGKHPLGLPPVVPPVKKRVAARLGKGGGDLAIDWPAAIAFAARRLEWKQRCSSNRWLAA